MDKGLYSYKSFDFVILQLKILILKLDFKVKYIFLLSVM